ncbi:immunoglobulin-like and fibronectin type III domain-containing protein 1 isoform X19 [Tympanuchus pallidicinctus]|uniref:immunoglobulin-like and fibronectin type III domain-containing protein 1 isoform X18 n=1 Tax=Tympanuchus pallidicinctus TaxID=109042 RepID=UPI0022875BCE|nr:immunoglobulin-like and fibronectin type III domain-containing protein 1 isoform X18 [Tympanuchus pallidicinctus]XP_052558444.1 immunoglobulin-like and fibronectin type III domain-containing protein 1 isoform X19 [Tympanuchus pallidicinctus]
MTTRPGVKTLQKSSIRGVHITQFVDKIPKGCSTPDFERKPVSLTLQEGKNAIFRAVVKGVPAPEVKWKRAKGEINDPAKYLMFYSPATSEHILQINKITAGDSDLYRCFAVNEYGEASCSAGLRIIQVGFKRKANYVTGHPAEELKKSLQDLKKTLKKRAPLPKQKVLDKDAVFQLLLHADKKDYERICIKYGISDFRGMLRALQDLRKDTENEQAKLIHSIKYMEHIKVNKDGSASFTVEMDLKSASSNIYLLKDGEKVRYGTGDEYRKYYLRQIGKRYHFIVNDVHPEDAGLYQVRVEDVPIFSTELDAESIPVRFQKPLRDLHCHEDEDVVFDCVLRSPCFDAVWLHKAHPLEASEKHQISVSPDGLSHQLIIKNAVTADSGLYTLDTGLCSSRAWLLVEHAREAKIQDEEHEKSDHQKGTPDKDRAKRLKRGEYVGDEDHPMDAGMKRGGWHRSDHGGGQGYSPDADGEFKLLGKEGLHKIGDEIMGPGQFAREEDTGLKFGEDKIGLRHVHSQDSMSGRGDTDDGLGGGTKSHSVAGRHDSMLGAADVDMGDAEGAYSWHDKNAKLGDASSGAAFGGMKSLDATDGSSVSGGINLGSAGVGGAHSVYSKDGLPAAVDMNAVSINREGEIGSPYSKGNLLVDAGGHVGQAGMSGLLYGAGGVPAGDGGRPGAGGSFVGEMEVLYGPDGLPVGAGVDAKRGDLYGKHGQSSEPYGKDGLPAGMEAGLGGAGLEGAGSVYGKGAAGGAAGAGQFGPLYGKDGLPAGAVIGGTGAGGVGSPFGKDGLPAGAGAGVDGAGLAGAGGVGFPYGKDGLPAGAGVDGAAAGAGVDGAGLAGAGGVGFPYGKDGLPAGGGVDGAGLAGAGGVGFPYGKDGLPAGAGVGAAGLAGAGGVGFPYGKDGLPAGAGVGAAGLAGAGGVGFPYGKDGLPAGAGVDGAAGAGVDGAGLAGAGGLGIPFGKDGLPAGAGVGAAGLAGAGGVGFPYGKDGLPAGAGAGVGAAGLAGAGGVGSPYGKDGLLAGADAGGAGLAGSPFGKDGLPAGAGVGAAALAGAGAAGSPFGKDGLPAGAGAGVGVAGLAGAGEVGSPYGKDGLPAGAGGSIAGVRDAGSSYGKDGLSAAAGSGAAHFPSGGEEVMGSHRGRDAMLGRAQGSLGGAGGAGLSSEGGGVGGSAIRGAGSAHGSAGSRAGESSAGRLGGDGSELYSVHGKEGVVGAVGMAGEYGLDSRAGKSPYGEAGKGTASDLRGSEHKGSSHDRESLSGQGDARAEARDLGQSGSPYDRDSSFGGAEGKFHDKLFSGWKPGISSQSSQGSDQMSALHGGPSVSQRKQGPGLDIKAGDFLKSTESTENRRRHHLDDLKAPRSRVNKQLADVRVLKGEPTELSCAVNRHDLTGTWFKDGLKLTSMEGVTLEKEGLVHKLIISKVEDIHAGKYRFEAGDIKTEASIFVEDPPQVNEILLKNLMSVPTVAKAGEKVVIKIPFEGRLPVRAMWLKDKIELGDDSRIRVDKTDTFTMLSISNAERKDCGDYKVRLKNDSGILDIDLKVEVIDKPQRPAGPLKIVESSANDVTIQWNPPKDDGGKPVQNYIIEKQQVGKSDWVTVGETPRSCTTFTTSKVEQDMSYYFRVRAVNAEGSSDALESDEVVTISKATPGAPDPPEIVGVSADTITISWKAPRKTGSSRISGYIVQKRKMGSMTWVPVNSVPIADKKLKVTDLKKGLQYEFCVAAVNASGMGDISAASQAAFARDSTKPPGKVRDLKMTISDSSSVTLTWNVPEAEEGSGAKGYNVEMRSANSLSWTKCNIFPIETTTYKIKGLQAKESYFLRVRAINDCGPGEATELEAFTEVVRPVVFPRFIIDKTVKNFLLIKAGNAIRVNIPFEAPPDSVLTWLKDGASLPSRAKISTQDGSSQLLIKAAEFTDSGIYTVELTSGTGKRETFSFQVQVTDIPQPPGPIELRENVPNIVTVTWEPSTSEKWESNLYYTVMKRESQKGVWHVVGDLIYTNKFTYTSVIPGRDYYFRVVAKNYLGSSRPSDTAQPWRIRKQKADVQLRPQRYKGVNQNQPPRFLVPLKPHVVIPGTECRMSCAVGGHPPPKITWYKDGRDLSNNPSYFGTNNFGVCSLVIFGASKADEGDYMVEATNDLGRAFSKASLIVKDSCL